MRYSDRKRRRAIRMIPATIWNAIRTPGRRQMKILRRDFVRRLGILGGVGAAHVDDGVACLGPRCFLCSAAIVTSRIGKGIKVVILGSEWLGSPQATNHEKQLTTLRFSKLGIYFFKDPQADRKSSLGGYTQARRDKVADEVAAGCEQPTASVTFAAAVLLYQKTGHEVVRVACALLAIRD